jgi:hypothetical protein
MAAGARGDDALDAASAPSPDIQHVAVLGAEIVDPALPGLRIRALAVAIDRDQSGLDVRLHLAAVAAEVNGRAGLDQIPDPLALRRRLRGNPGSP